jgi:hypothetical protein
VLVMILLVETAHLVGTRVIDGVLSTTAHDKDRNPNLCRKMEIETETAVLPLRRRWVSVRV